MKKSVVVVLIALTLLGIVASLSGCSEMVLLHPKGPIGDSERRLIIVAFVLMLLVVVPVIVMAIWFPLKYRASNPKAKYDPTWTHSGRIETVVWLVPLAIVLVLSVITWRETHRLDPYRPLDVGVEPLRVDVVSLDWKWLFIYPDQGIAVVNELVFPARVPLSFRLTSDTVMTSFFIPQLGSQIYAMGGMQTRLHLMADTEGVYAGQNQQFSGRGFPTMTFAAKALSQQAFEAWVQKVKASPDKLDIARLDALRKPSEKDPVQLFSSIAPGLFEYVMHKTAPMAPHYGDIMMHAQGHGGHGQPDVAQER